MQCITISRPRQSHLRPHSSLSSDCDADYELHEVSTPHAVLTVAREGNITGPVIITFHDLGLNHVTNFKVRTRSLSLSLSPTVFDDSFCERLELKKFMIMIMVSVER